MFLELRLLLALLLTSIVIIWFMFTGNESIKKPIGTVQSILFRFGFDNDLNFVLPPHGNHLVNQLHKKELTEPFETEWLDEVKQKIPWHQSYFKERNYDIFNIHTVWNKSAVRDLLGPDTMYFTILRHPVDVFESLYGFEDFKKELNLTLHEYIKSLNVTEKLYQWRKHKYLGLNQQLYDLGLSANYLYNSTAVEEMIKKIDDEFDLVLIREKFDESMILLANKLCWPLEYVKSFILNARMSIHKVDLSFDELNILKSWQKGDLLLYNFFKNKLEEQVKMYGYNRMKEDLKKLEDLKTDTQERCIVNETDTSNIELKANKPFSRQVTGYNIKQEDNDCKLLTMAELQLVNFIRKRQAFRWKNHQKSMLYRNLLYISISSILVILIIMSALLVYFPKKSIQHCFFWTIFYYGHL